MWLFSCFNRHRTEFLWFGGWIICPLQIKKNRKKEEELIRSLVVNNKQRKNKNVRKTEFIFMRRKFDAVVRAYSQWSDKMLLSSVNVHNNISSHFSRTLFLLFFFCFFLVFTIASNACSTYTALLPSMIHRKNGKIVFVSSVAGKVPIPFRSSYAASKHALQAFSDSLRAEVAMYNVKVLVSSPEYIAFDLSHHDIQRAGTPNEGKYVFELAVNVIFY